MKIGMSGPGGKKVKYRGHRRPELDIDIYIHHEW